MIHQVTIVRARECKVQGWRLFTVILPAGSSEEELETCRRDSKMKREKRRRRRNEIGEMGKKGEERRAGGRRARRDEGEGRGGGRRRERGGRGGGREGGERGGEGRGGICTSAKMVPLLSLLAVVTLQG